VKTHLQAQAVEAIAVGHQHNHQHPHLGPNPISHLLSTIVTEDSAIIDPAELERLQKAVSAQGVLLGSHDQMLWQILETLQALMPVQLVPKPTEESTIATASAAAEATVAEPTALPTSSDATISTPVTDTRLATPEKYDGPPEKCPGFLIQCELIFASQPHVFQRDASRMAGPPPSGTKEDPTMFERFRKDSQALFDHSLSAHTASDRLMTIQQGSRTIAAYSLEFRTLVGHSGWNQAALLAFFRRGLHPRIQAELAYWGLIPTPRAAPDNQEAPGQMHLGQGWLTPEERQRRLRGHLRLYCREAGHFRTDCPSRRPSTKPRQGAE
ncbi:hypothetical protein Z043_115406, partial [Scleropages formosus]